MNQITAFFHQKALRQRICTRIALTSSMPISGWQDTTKHRDVISHEVGSSVDVS
jgi:hypothetical protein